MESGSCVLQEDFRNVLQADFIDWQMLKKKTIMITGATGLIGASIIRSLYYINQKLNFEIRILALVRDEIRAKECFAGFLEGGSLSFIVGSIECLPDVDDHIDYIIHGAGQTASKEFVQHAVETISTSVLGTFNILKLAKDKAVKGVVYLSSMEVYGYPERGHKVTEDEIGTMIPLDLRNSYPISKVAAESMCCAYVEEYGVPVKICRLTQTFGPGVSYNDTRIFASLGRCVNEKKNIILKTKGETERCYLYTVDAVTAILAVLLKGEPGRAYNAADENTYCSIAEMAGKVAFDGGIEVEYDIQDEKADGFLRTLYMNLDTAALRSLGWKPRGYSIGEMYQRMVRGFNKDL